MTWFLTQCALIPVYRQRDGAGFEEKTKASFARVVRMFAEEAAHVLIFAEGNAKAESRLRPLSSGFARLAFDAVQACPDVLLQPVSVQYEEHASFRKGVRITIHPTIALKDWLP
ncbi:1-acyl-sn-glycerol-3-phosphate acyltransferase, partial [Arthrospira platensis SPKY1]|nr:1-acyl-sn-glycerol-3-phosphate acyltransferase [Arthrospira platensis SPKY1]